MMLKTRRIDSRSGLRLVSPLAILCGVLLLVLLFGCGDSDSGSSEDDPNGCTPECGERECGSDPACNTSCGVCEQGYSCTENGACVPEDCTPECGERECGPDPACNTSCGVCEQGYSCNAMGFCVDTTSECEPNLFVDSFESADMSATNEDGFRWANNNRTSIVTMDPGPLAVWNNGPVNNAGPPDADWTALDGDYSLRFRYPAGEYWSEQRFDLGSPQPELWIRYWLRVPTNFRHGHTSPTNNKFFALWMDGYSQHGDGPTIVWNFWREGETDSSRFTYSVSETGASDGGHHSSSSYFIRSPEDQGRWMQVVLYAKMSTDAESMDGESRIYRRWEDEETFTLIGETTNKNFSAPAGGPNGWHAGYIMGWSNPAYLETTEWLLDKFELSTESLICDRAPQ